MEQIYQSAVLQALGWALADSLWQMALLWLACQVFIVLPFKQPHIRHAGAAVALLTGGVWFTANIIYKISHATSTLQGKGYIHPTLLNWIQGTLPYLSSAYLVVLVVLMTRFAQSIIITQRLRITESAPAGHWQDLVDQMALRFFISRKVWVRITNAVSVPATIGFMKPVILLPLASVNNLSTAQVEAIIMHELAHISRNDYLLNLIASFIENILFFNPFAHLLMGQMRKECELCCDDAVILRQQDRGQYAQALLMLEKSRQQYPLAMAATGKESLLLGRIKRILQQPEQKVKYRHKLLALVVVAAMIMGLSLLNPSNEKKSEAPLSRIVKAERSGAGKIIDLKTISSMPAPEKRVAQATPKPDRPRMDAPAKTHREEPADLAFAPFPPDPHSPMLPPPPPLMPDMPAPGIDGADQFVYINTPDPRDLARAMEHLSEGRMMADMDRQFRQFQQTEEIFRQLAEEKGRFNIEMFRFNEDQQTRERQQGKKTIVVPRAPRAPGAAQPINKKVKAQQAEDVYKAIALSHPGNIRTFQTEDGMTIRIIEGEGTIRISFSDK